MAITYGSHSLEHSDIPEVSRLRMLQTAFNHIMGNEVASQVVGRIRDALKGEGKAADVTIDAIKAWRADKSNEVQLDAWEKQYRDEKVKAILDGTLSVRAAGSGTVRDPVETASRAIAKMEISAILANNGAKFPGKDATVTIGNDTLSGDDLIARRLAHPEHGPRIRKAAEQKVAQDRRLRDNAAKAAGGEGGLAESLGL